MKRQPTIDTAGLSLMLTELRLPTIKGVWEEVAERADKEGWQGGRLLTTLLEQELAERERRRIARHLNDARLLPGKTLETFDFAAVPMVSRAQVTALAEGTEWLERGANVLLFGPPGGGKSQVSLLSARIEVAGQECGQAPAGRPTM